MNQEVYTESDIGAQVRTTIEGVEYIDTIVGVWMPDQQFVIGPRLKCAHMFARFSMVPGMTATSDAIQESMGGGV